MDIPIEEFLIRFFGKDIVARELAEKAFKSPTPLSYNPFSDGVLCKERILEDATKYLKT